MKRMRTAVMIPLAVWVVVTIPGLAETQQGMVTINLTDTRGIKLPAGILSIRSSQGRVVYSAEVANEVVVHLPFGHYTFTFETNWFQPVHRDVDVNKPESFVELAATFVPEGGNAPSSISIKVDPAANCSGDGFLWARLVGVYSGDVVERRINSRGFALFEPVEAGVYVVIVVDGSMIRVVSPIMTTRQITTATLTLAPCK